MGLLLSLHAELLLTEAQGKVGVKQFNNLMMLTCSVSLFIDPVLSGFLAVPVVSLQRLHKRPEILMTTICAHTLFSEKFLVFISL